jgi:type II secretory pathway pseudopilin PulG
VSPNSKTKPERLQALPERPVAPPGVGIPSRIANAAFTLIEILVVVGLLSLIILGLLAMFHQVQKAFRASMTQTDVLEAGRAITDLVARDFEQMAPTRLGDAVSGRLATNFMTRIDPNAPTPVVQYLAGTTSTNVPWQGPFRTNILQDVFFTSKQNQSWMGIGYQVRPDYLDAGIGTLYRFSTDSSSAARTDVARLLAQRMSSNFLYSTSFPLTNNPPNLNRIADGVIHFRVRAFDTNGRPFYIAQNSPYLWSQTNVSGAPISGISISNAFGFYRPTILDQVTQYHLDYSFVSNAVPGYVELEVAFLEPHMVDRFRAIGGSPLGVQPAASLQAAQRNFLSNHVAQVHLFRQRIPIRNIDFAAYK